MPGQGTYDEFDFGHFRSGETYVVPSRIASVLILDGYAELVAPRPSRAEAADFGTPKLPRRKGAS